MKNTEIIRKFDPNQPRDEFGMWTDTGQGEKIKVYRGTGRNYAEGENEGFLWVSTDKSVASNYADLDDDGNLMVEEFEIEKPKKPFQFGYTNPNQYVTAENVGNIWRRELTKLAKAKEITIDEWRKTSDLIRDWEKMAGSKVQMLHTLLNKPATAKTSAQIIFNLGYDALEISEGDSVTYGLLKNVKNLQYNFILKFDPNQPRDENGRWTDTGASSSDSQEGSDENNEESTELTDDEIASIKAYTRNDFKNLTTYQALQDEPEKLAQFLENNRPNDLSPGAFEFKLALMSEEIENGINKMRLNPKYQYTGNVFRGDSWSASRQNSFNRQMSLFQDAFDNDEIVTYETFMSTSTDSKVGGWFQANIHTYKIDYIIKVKNGALIKEYSQHPTEDEVLLLPGSKFKVISIDQDVFTDKEDYLIELELIN